MERYIEKLNSYVQAHPPTFDENGVDSVFDTLYWTYAECNHLENGVIQDNFQTLYGCLAQLCLRDTDKVMDIVYALCTEHQRISFAAGVQIGVHLTQELMPLRRGGY